MTAAKLAAAAQGLIGTPFRLHGRDPALGLDCVGLLEAALCRAGHPVRLPSGYALRTRVVPDFDGIAASCGLVRCSGGIDPGDVVVAQPSACQVHLLIAAPGGNFVHAHAGLGRTVLMPGPLPWPELSRFRPGAPS